MTWPAGGKIEIETHCSINKSSVIEVCLQIPDLGWSILIDEAVVQWVKGNRLGLSFVSVRAPEGDRLAWIMARRALASFTSRIISVLPNSFDAG